MSALPAEATTLRGGCACRAIRYTMSIPPLASRPVFCAATADSDEVRFPLLVLDHCNDCRRATGGLVNFWTMCPLDYVELSLLRRGAAEEEEEEGEQRTVVPAEAALRPGAATAGTYMLHYQSPVKAEVTRMFCGRCGTNTSYAYYRLPAEFGLNSIDLLLGTLDREDLERVRPDRHVWWDCGVGWVQRWVTQGDGVLLKRDGGQHLPRHPTIYMHEFAKGYADDGAS